LVLRPTHGYKDSNGYQRGHTNPGIERHFAARWWLKGFRFRRFAGCLFGGGVGSLDHLVQGVRDGHASAVLAASIFHFGTFTIREAKAHMRAAGLAVRLD